MGLTLSEVIADLDCCRLSNLIHVSAYGLVLIFFPSTTIFRDHFKNRFFEISSRIIHRDFHSSKQ